MKRDLKMPSRLYYKGDMLVTQLVSREVMSTDNTEKVSIPALAICIHREQIE